MERRAGSNGEKRFIEGDKQTAILRKRIYLEVEKNHRNNKIWIVQSIHITIQFKSYEPETVNKLCLFIIGD